MPTFNQFTLPDGTSILVEISEDVAPGADAGPVAIGDRIIKTAKSLREVFQPIGGMINELRASIVEKIPAPDEVELEFGAKIGGDFGVVIAKSEVEANIKITVKWTKEKKAH